MADYDAIVIGAGHNGLVTAAYLAKAGRKILVLERRAEAGGTLASREIAPGVKAPALFHTVGRLRKAVMKDLGLARHGLSLIDSPVRVFAPQPDGTSVTLWADAAKTSVELRERSVPDAEAYAAFDQKVRSLASFLAYIAAATPPDVAAPSLGDAIAGLKLGRAFKALGAKAGREAMRALPMAVADYVGETFESDALRGALAVRGVQFTKNGPWSAGTTANLLMDSAGNDGGAAGQTTFAKGGPGALAAALESAARSFGAEIRLGAEVDHVSVDPGGRVNGVVLSGGEEIQARTVVSSADPKTTLVDWVDPVVLGPHLRWRAGNIRTPGTVAKVNLALSGVPRFAGAEGDERLRGRIVIAPGIDYLERAFDASKYGRVSAEPFLEATIQSLSDPTVAPEGQHVMSVLVQWAPYALRDGDWETEREGLGDLVLKTLESYAPGLSELVTARDVLTPVDLERDLGLPQGHPLHAEPGLDSFFAWRPLFGHARYRYGLPGLYLCGSGAHPGGGITGGPGANAAREILSHLK
jgi:phytoene dehydrogenase-like protein